LVPLVAPGVPLAMVPVPSPFGDVALPVTPLEEHGKVLDRLPAADPEPFVFGAFVFEFGAMPGLLVPGADAPGAMGVPPKLVLPVELAPLPLVPELLPELLPMLPPVEPAVPPDAAPPEPPPPPPPPP